MEEQNKIRFAHLDDTQLIMDFIHNEWKNDHILSRDRQFFLYEHQNQQALNFVISENSDNKITGILGYIAFSYGSKLDISTVMWKVLPNAGSPMLGIELLEFLRNSNKFRVVMSSGINAKTAAIYNYLGMYTNHLNHFVLINSEIKKFQIAKISSEITPQSFLKDSDYQLKPVDEEYVEKHFDFETYKENIPYKDQKFFIKRYFQHPIYSYNVYGIFHKSRLTSLLVTRTVNVENSNVLRVVDFIGNEDELPYISHDLYDIILQNKYEYADFICFGLQQETFEKAGFIQVDLDSEDIIIPNYFAPFEQKNIKINFFADTQDLNHIKIFKADGDQDRPS